MLDIHRRLRRYSSLGRHRVCVHLHDRVDTLASSLYKAESYLSVCTFWHSDNSAVSALNEMGLFKVKVVSEDHRFHFYRFTETTMYLLIGMCKKNHINT